MNGDRYLPYGLRKALKTWETVRADLTSVVTGSRSYSESIAGYARCRSYREFYPFLRATYVGSATSAFSCISCWHRTSVHQVQYPGFEPRTSTCVLCVNTALLAQYVPRGTYCGKSAVFTHCQSSPQRISWRRPPFWFERCPWKCPMTQGQPSLQRGCTWWILSLRKGGPRLNQCQGGPW